MYAARFCSKKVGAGMRHSFTCCSLIQARSWRNQSRQARTPGEAANPATDWASNGTVSFSLPRRVGREDRRQKTEDRRQKTEDNAQVDPRWFFHVLFECVQY